MSRDSRVIPPNAEINVTPMLDVLLVLLIIFIAANIPPVVPVMDTQLPIPCSGACEGGPSIVLEVLPGPSYRINHEAVTAPMLRDRIAAIYSGRPDKVLYVAGSPRVHYQEVVTAMDVARDAGVRVIGLAPSDRLRSR